MNESKVSINKLIDDTTNKIIKDFSGKGNSAKIRVIDNTIAFMGASGGTGTSTLVANIAYTVAKKGLSVLVVDMNILYPIQHSLFGLKQEIEKKDLVSFMLGRNSIGDSIESSKGVSVMYANNRYLIDYINCDTSACSSNLISAIKDIRQLFDLIIFDCPLRLEFDAINCILYECDKVYMVFDEGVSPIANIDRIRKNMQVSGIETSSKLKVILNKKTNVHYTNYVFDKLALELIAKLPFDTSIIESSLRGEIFCEKGASISKNASLFESGIKDLADKILAEGGYNG